ncbi:MAG: aminopeptidase N [Promicromonosporaceae bacterium]|nr:aminopeptidase N [Promicromonosporaceae bacterium]
MPGANLTHGEALERASIITEVHSYVINLDLTTGAKRFGSDTVIKFSAQPGSNTFLDLVDAKVSSVTLNGKELDPKKVYRDDRITLKGLKAENEVVVKARCRYSNTGEGLHRFVDPVDNQVYLYTQFEVPDARRVFANFEQPDLKSTFELSVIAPSNWQVISIQPGDAPVPTGAKGDIGTETMATSTFHFPPTPKLSTYLMALVAGPYANWHSELTSSDGRTIPLGVYCRQSLAKFMDADYIFDITKKGFAFYEKQFDYPYPFAKYDQLFVPEYNMGAMENPGCVTITEAYVFRSRVPDATRERRVITILHELAHMWFGDLVTMKWWNDLWLNESFAEFVSILATAEATEWKDAWATFIASEKTWAYHQDALPSTHPIVAPIHDLEDVYTNFDGITYAKGASALKQLAVYVGRANFMAGLHNYFERYAWSNATLIDLLTELERTSGRPLLIWAQKWLTSAGTNTLTTELTTDASGIITSFAVRQSAPADHPELRPQRLSVGLYNLDDDGTQVVRTSQISFDLDGELTEVPALVGAKRPDLILLNDDDLTFAKLRLDDKSSAFALEHVGQVTDPVARALIWTAIWDQVADGEMPAQKFIPAALANLSGETNSTTRAQVLADLSQATHQYLAPELRAKTQAELATKLWELAQAAPAGSDPQLQFLRSFAANATTPSQVATLRTITDGKQTLPGLIIDTDLRWDLLQGLAQNNALHDDEIATALAADNTATGKQAAARITAAIATPEAKKEAFESVVDHKDVPNAIIRATAAGFSRVDDAALLEPLAKRYLASLNGIWESRSYQMSEELISGLYPHRLVTPKFRDQVKKWLADNEKAAPALRRLVVEELADTERALKGQEVSAGAEYSK